MTTERNSPNSRPPEQSATWTPLSLHEWVSVLYGIVTFCFALAAILDVGNGLDNFLHAPIGIKDNPPEPRDVIQIAQLVVWPLALCWVALKTVKHFTATYPARQVLLYIGGLLLWLVLMVLLVGDFFHREFIPGSRYFWNEIVPKLVVAGLLFFDGFVAYLYLKDWNDKASRLAGVFFGLSTLCGVAGFIRWMVPTMAAKIPLVSLAVAFFVIANICAPKVSKPSPTVEPPA